MTNVKKLRELLALATTRPWKANTADKTGEDWLIGSLGNSNEDGQDWIVTTDRVRASELDGDAKFDAALIVAAVNALPALLDEVERMREALETISERHVPDQPAADGSEEADYVRKHHSELRRIARAAKET